MIYNPSVKIEKHGDKTVVIQTFDNKYFDELKGKIRHNLAGAKITPTLGGFQIHGKFMYPVKVPFEDISRHGRMTINDIPIQIHSPMSFMIQYVPVSKICKIGNIIEKLVCDKKSLLQRIKEDIDDFERDMGWRK